MNLRFIILVITQTIITSLAFSQINDDFSDGNFTDNPTWSGDTSNFIVNPQNQLQLLAPAQKDQSYLAVRSEIISSASWIFYVKLDFNPSSSNYMDIYLVSDSENLKGPLNGYFVRIGNSQDEVSLYKQTGDKSEVEKIIDGMDDRVDLSIVEIIIKVTKSPANKWEVLIDQDLDSNFISEGIAIDSTHFFSKYFGVLCNYTSTRSTKFFFDDLAITGEAYIDNDPPQIDTIFALSDSSLVIKFNERLSESSAADTQNYNVNNSIGNPYSATLQNDSTMVLLFQNKFADKIENQITINGIEDLFTNSLDNYNTTFIYRKPYIVGFGDVLVTEIMADPTPGVDLPEYEFLEIHNPHDDIFYINQAILVVGNDTVNIPNLVISPNEYIIFCQSSAVEHFENYGRTIKISNWPSLNNRGESVIILNQLEELVFSINYSNSWYQSIDKDDGGWSLEMIDTAFPCKGRENWKASKDPSGGTPGTENASKEIMTDFSAPQITQVIAISDTSVIIYLDEKISTQNISIENISVLPKIRIQIAKLQLPELSSIAISFDSPILPQIRYELTIKNLFDCAGNVQQSTSSNFVLPETADSLDLIVNEILFDPWTNGVDFVEIYNASEKYIDLKTISIGNENYKPISNEHSIIEPKQIIAITENPQTLNNHYPGIDPENLFKTQDLPPFNNDEGMVSLMNKEGKVIDFFRYSEDNHSGFLRDTEGVSLERISFERPSNNPNNWQSAASTSGFATPGKMNSQFFISTENNEEVTIEPEVFAPGNTGRQDFVLIKCRFAASGNMANIKILDSNGRHIKTIISHKSIGAEEDFKWEGMDDNGQMVRMGYYIVFVEIYNSTGDKKLYRKKVVVGGQF